MKCINTYPITTSTLTAQSNCDTLATWHQESLSLVCVLAGFLIRQHASHSMVRMEPRAVPLEVLGLACRSLSQKLSILL